MSKKRGTLSSGNYIHAKAKRLTSAQDVRRETGSSFRHKHGLFKEGDEDGAGQCRALNASKV